MADEEEKLEDAEDIDVEEDDEAADDDEEKA